MVFSLIIAVLCDTVSIVDLEWLVHGVQEQEESFWKTPEIFLSGRADQELQTSSRTARNIHPLGSSGNTALPRATSRGAGGKSFGISRDLVRADAYSTAYNTGCQHMAHLEILRSKVTTSSTPYLKSDMCSV